MAQSFYDKQDYVFGQAMLTLRTRIGLTQVGLAELLGVSRKAVSRWEAGSSYPKAEHLKTFLTFAVKQHVFQAGHEAEEIKAFWQAAHQKVLLDELWLQELLSTQRPRSTHVMPESSEETRQREQVVVESVLMSHVDWGDAPAITTFYGREQELALLTSWIVEEHCQVVSVLGLGGIGKSVLAVRLMHRIAERFEVVIWRSLRDAPVCETLLDECLKVLAPQTLRDVSVSLEQGLNLLLEYLQHARVLLVLDNLEVLLKEGRGTGHMRPGYEGYTRLLRRIAETKHQSCLLLTSREKPSDLVPQEGGRTPIRSLRLAQLDADSCKHLFAEKEVVGTSSEQARLTEAYAGNPLALKIVAQTIVDLFDGQIAPFLEQNEVVFGGVRELLDEQYDRLADLEQTVLFWLAILREPVTLKDLLVLLAMPRSSTEMLEAVEALRRRSLIERGQHPGSFTLQSVVMEYTTARLIAEVASEIEQGRPAHLIEHALELATVKEYIRQTQQRLLVAPLLAQLRTLYLKRVGVERQLLILLDELRTRADYAQGYGPANLLILLREWYGHLRGLDLSLLTIRGMYLQGIEMQDSSLVKSAIRETIFNGAFDIIWSVAVSNNGKYWAVGSRRGEVRVWRKEGKLLHLAWQAHGDTVRALAFNPDGDTLATGSWDGDIKLWDIESGAMLWANQLIDNIESLAFAPDGCTLASGGGDAKTGVHQKTIAGHGGSVFALAWMPNGRLLASGGVDGDIRLWELSRVQSEIPIRILAGHTDWVLGLAFSPDGAHLASGSWDASVRLWDVESGEVRQMLTGHVDRVRAVAWSSDGHLLASCGFDQTIWLWDVERGSYRTGLHGHSAGVYDLAFTSDNRSLLSGSEDGSLRVWNVKRGQCVDIMQGYTVSLYDVAWSPDGTQLASAGSNRLVTIWSLEGLTPPKPLHGHHSLVFGVEWSPDGQFLASSGWDNAVRLWNGVTGEAQRILQDPDHANALFYGLVWNLDGTQLACASYRRGVQVWDVTGDHHHWVGRGQSTRIRRVVWSPGGTYLASCGDDGSICLWEAADGTLLRQWTGHDGIVMSVVWSPDGMRLASCGGKERGKIHIWEARSGERVQTLAEHVGTDFAIVWSPGGEMLISGGSDGTLRWWEVQSGQRMRVQEGHQAAVRALKVSPDGNRLASCGDDGAIMLWDLHNGEHLQTLREDRPYERLNITGIRGLSEVQKASLYALGAFEETSVGE